MQLRIAVIAGLALSGLFVAVVPGTPAVGQGPYVEPRLTITHAGLSTRAALGTFCTKPPGETLLCADDFAPPRSRARLPVRPGGRVVLKPGFEPRSVVARLMRQSVSRSYRFIGRKLPVERLAPRRWAVRLRRDLGGANALDLFITWNNERDGRGDADFAIRIRMACTT